MVVRVLPQGLDLPTPGTHGHLYLCFWKSKNSTMYLSRYFVLWGLAVTLNYNRLPGLKKTPFTALACLFEYFFSNDSPCILFFSVFKSYVNHIMYTFSLKNSKFIEKSKVPLMPFLSLPVPGAAPKQGIDLILMCFLLTFFNVFTYRNTLKEHMFS